MKEYKHKFPYSKWRQLTLILPAILLVVIINVINIQEKQSLGEIESYYPIILLPLVLILLILGSAWYNIRKYGNIIVTIQIDENKISAMAPKMFHRTIEREDVEAIYEMTNGTLIVKKDTLTNITIPFDIEGYQEIRAILRGWKDFSATKTLSQALSFRQVFPAIVFFAGVFGSGLIPNEQIASIFAFLGVAGGVHLFYLLHKVRNTVPKLARVRWFLLLILLGLCSKAILPILAS